MTVEPPDGRPSQIRHRTPPNSNPDENTGLSSPPFDTQLFSQTQQPHKAFSYEVEDEEGENVWGYLLPLDANGGEPLVLRLRAACPVPRTKPMKQSGNKTVKKDEYTKEEEAYEETKVNGKVSSGYLIGRHPECGKQSTRCSNLMQDKALNRSRSCYKHADDLKSTLSDIPGKQRR